MICREDSPPWETTWAESSRPAEAKAALVYAHAGLPNDWLNRMGPDYVARYLNQCQHLSVKLRDDCARLGLAFFDTGADFNGALDAAERCLARD